MEKTEVLKRANKLTFPKGIVHGFCPKIKLSLIAVYHRNYVRKIVLKRAIKWAFSKGVTPWILSKNRIFYYCCFSQKLFQKRSFFDILDRKQPLLDQKIEVLKRA